jgi:hypothetical protein
MMIIDKLMATKDIESDLKQYNDTPFYLYS